MLATVPTISAQQQKFRVTPQDLQVLEGSEALLRCEVSNLAGQVQWTKDGFALGKHILFSIYFNVIYVAPVAPVSQPSAITAIHHTIHMKHETHETFIAAFVLRTFRVHKSSVMKFRISPLQIRRTFFGQRRK